MNLGGVIVPTKKPRYTVIVDEDVLKEIDDFRFENRYPSRSAATLELIKRGIEQLREEREATPVDSGDGGRPVHRSSPH